MQTSPQQAFENQTIIITNKINAFAIMRMELNNDNDFAGADFTRGTLCAVCGKPIGKPPALWIVKKTSPMDFFLHKDSEPLFTPEIVKKSLGDLALVMQDESLHDVPPERN